ncbi:MAG: hypothetical protein HZB23_06510 [Deltaproteobacteria bacterium]|nr:hypothetical protein [Deltaproteobacteria bacterium]
MKTLTVMFLMLLIGFNVSAGELREDAYNDFEGIIGSNAKICLTLFPLTDGTIKGHYFYRKYERKITIEGTYSKNSIILNELDEKGDVRATFKGVYNDSFAGTWRDNASKKELAFSLSFKQICVDGAFESGSGEFYNRYSVMNVNDDKVVEDFARKAKTSILKGDYAQLANYISFPITVSINAKRRKIKNADEFVKVADQIFTQGFLHKLRESPTTDMLVNWQGAMIGDGEIWIGTDVKQVRDKHHKDGYRLVEIIMVIAINPVYSRLEGAGGAKW